MTANQYPFFESGQTLTAADLNMVREFQHARDRLVGRMTGFGVNCGLGGSVSGTTLTIQPGLAVDQPGEPLVLPTAQPINLAPPAMNVSYDFIDTAPGGFSVVLEATDEPEAAPDCGEGDCAGHATLHTVGVALRTVAGRVTGTRMDFSDDELLKAEPIRLALDSTPVNSYAALRDLIEYRLKNGTEPLVDPALIAKLKATSVDSADSPGAQGYKCGWLNMVLFATLDLLRARALLHLSCDRTTTRPGVVLGWVHQVGGDWTFECAYRHAWEPPRGLTEVFFGGTCDNPASRLQDELEALLAGFAPPAPVPQGEVEPPVFCPKGSILIRGKCVNIFYPPEQIPHEWAERWRINPRDPIWYPPFEEKWKQPWEIYQTEGWDFFEDGVFGATDYLGRPADVVRDKLRDFITSTSGAAVIKVVDVGAVDDMKGYLPSGGFSPSDTIVLTKDAAGKVIATGRVPAVRNVRIVGAALPEAVSAATDAKAAATEMRGLTATVVSRVDTAEANFSGLKRDFTTLHGEFQSYKGGAFDSSGYGVRIATAEAQLKRLEEVQHRISLVEGKVDVLAKLPKEKTIDRNLGKGVSEFAQATVAAMQSLPEVQNPNFQRYTAAAARARADLDSAIAAGDPELVTEATLAVLGTVRTMVKASGVSAEHGRELDTQLRNLGGLIT
ncbi:hypothetical protein [Streptomyces spongiae]|uniref:Uncharacterized protein n=1 Tax=Streptomyces spongiae TaxID=565072 RepID=A0A5N8X8J0_9ACTN|nr:hypothetical protein [Streptomyces spongiae]MPY55729.1 hypothetical protein [Streptomyces spongiae]